LALINSAVAAGAEAAKRPLSLAPPAAAAAAPMAMSASASASAAPAAAAVPVPMALADGSSTAGAPPAAAAAAAGPTDSAHGGGSAGGGDGGDSAAAAGGVVPRADWTADQTGEWLSSLGAAYGAYRTSARDHGLNGSLLTTIANEKSDETAFSLLADAGIANGLHRRLVLKHIRQYLANK
jgi:hypothetical protein